MKKHKTVHSVFDYRQYHDVQIIYEWENVKKSEFR